VKIGTIDAIQNAEVAVKVAIPKLDNNIAPCFEVAGSFAVVETDGPKIESLVTYDCEGCEGYSRIRLLGDHGVNILICGGIKSFYRDLLATSGIKIISGINTSIQTAIDDFMGGKLSPDDTESDESVLGSEIPHEDLVCWTRELFESQGYKVSAGPGGDAFLVDLVAEIQCPLCGQAVVVAICCGAHTYRPDREIGEFHLTEPTRYNARVFVHPSDSTVERCCREYGIQLIDPNNDGPDLDRSAKNRLPILRGAILGHDRIAY